MPGSLFHSDTTPVLLSRRMEDPSTGPASDDSRFSINRGNQAATILILMVCLALFIAWLVYSFRNYYSLRIEREENGSDQDRTNEEDLPSLEQAKQTLLDLFERHRNQTLLSNDDIRMDVRSLQTNQEPVSLEEGPVGHLVVSRTFASRELHAPNFCAICLESYSTGESITWSLNERCQHIYHTTCIINCFACEMNKGCPCLCPTCRQIFCLVDHGKNKEDETENNPSTIDV